MRFWKFFSLVAYCCLLLLFTTCKKEINRPETGNSAIKYFIGGQNDKVIKVEKTADGGFIYCGSTIQGGAKSDAFLLKVDSNGIQQWYHTYGYEYDDVFNHCISTSDGGFLAVGSTNIINKGNNDSSIFSIDYTVKVDLNGGIEWSKRKNSGYSTLYGAIESPDHFFYITGSAYGNTFTGDNTVLVKMDPMGNLIYNKQFTAFQFYQPYKFKDTWIETGMSISWAKDGSLLIGGVMSASTTYPVSDRFVTFLLSVKTNGTVNFYYPYYDYIRETNYSRYNDNKNPNVKILNLVDGYLAGTYFELPGSKLVFQLIKTDLSGNIQWEKKYSGLGNTIMKDMILMEDGNIAMVGTSTNTDMALFLPESFVNLKCMILKLDKEGYIIEENYIGSDQNTHIGQCLESFVNGGWLVAGASSISKQGYDKMFLMKVDKDGKLISND